MRGPPVNHIDNSINSMDSFAEHFKDVQVFQRSVMITNANRGEGVHS